MARLAEDLLDTARIGSGKLDLARRAVDLRTTIASAIEMTRAQVERREQTLTSEVGRAPVMVEGDCGRLVQIVANLIDNAARYTPYGGQITVGLAVTACLAIVEVRDTGIGLPASALESIFSPFVQVPDASAFDAGGLGLGLALVRSLTEFHDGTVHATSAGAGQGSG